MSQDSLPRLKDVAKAASVSVPAASRILRGDTDSFSDDTTQRVLRIAKKLGYRRNLLVNGIQTGRTKTVGVLVPPYDSFWIGVIDGIHKQLADVDFLPITVWIGDHDHFPYFEDTHDKGIELINRLLDRRVDGLIMWPQIAVSYRTYFLEEALRTTPVTIVDEHSPIAFGDTVVNDEVAATGQVVDLLTSFGHRDFCCLSEPEDPAHAWSKVRTQAFVDNVVAKTGKEPVVDYISPQDPGAMFVAIKLLGQSPKPTAVFAVTDHHAEVIYRAAAQLGKRIPEDLSVVGFGNLVLGYELTPALTTVDQNPRQIGMEAAKLVISRVLADQNSNQAKVQKIQTNLIPRESVALAKKVDS